MKQIIIALVLLILLPVAATASDVTPSPVADNLPAEAAGIVGGMNPSAPNGDLNNGLGGVAKLFAGLFKTTFGEGLKTMLVVFLICTLAAAFGADNPVVRIGAVSAIAALALTGAQSLTVSGREVIGQLAVYSKALLPTLAAFTAAAGQPTKAVLQQSAAVFGCDLLITIYERVVLPLCGFYAALITVDAILPKAILARMAQFVLWITRGILTLGLTAFTAYLSISGALAGKTDALAVRAARTALAGGLPVVGGILSDASETVLCGADVVRGGIGVAGMVAVLAVVALPFVGCGVRYLLFKAGGAVCSTLDDRLGGYVDKISALYGTLLGTIGAAAVLLLLGIALAIQ